MTAKKRPPRLGDLFVIRTPDDAPLTFSSENDEESISVHVVKLNGPDSDAVEIRAQAARARRMATVNDPESDEYLSHEATVADLAPEALVEMLVNNEMQKAMVEVPARVRGSAKWSDDDRLRSLEEAWYGDPENGDLGLLFVWAGAESVLDGSSDLDEERRMDLEDDLEEAKRIWAQLEQYEEEVKEGLEDRRLEIVEEYDNDGDLDDPEHVARLRVEVGKLTRKLDADLAYLEELRRQRIYYCTRQVSDWRKRYFESLKEVDELPDWVQTQILDVYNSLSLTGAEGKGSPGIPGSSPSSDPFDEEDPSLPSGLASASV